MSKDSLLIILLLGFHCYLSTFVSTHSMWRLNYSNPSNFIENFDPIQILRDREDSLQTISILDRNNLDLILAIQMIQNNQIVSIVHYGSQFIFVCLPKQILLVPIESNRFNSLGIYESKIIYTSIDSSRVLKGMDLESQQENRIYFIDDLGTIESIQLCPHFRYEGIRTKAPESIRSASYLLVDSIGMQLIWGNTHRILITDLNDMKKHKIIYETDDETISGQPILHNRYIYWTYLTGLFRFDLKKLSSSSLPLNETKILLKNMTIAAKTSMKFFNNELYLISMSRWLYRLSWIGSSKSEYHFEMIARLLNSSYFLTSLEFISKSSDSSNQLVWCFEQSTILEHLESFRWPRLFIIAIIACLAILMAIFLIAYEIFKCLLHKCLKVTRLKSN
ncbi:hypothetical protein SSS_02854 [Sarcoptes scabiei]|uniref:Uncharacterized protein n=1 Tax=Sarcoptes scabiei TaxID=52283 RepID=A0A834R431_SARSC|nr:hypothetical protein SSS_02854 [Sarcoptes scabiei]